MNRPASSKFVPGLPSDDDIDTQTNSASPNSVKIYDGVADCPMNDADTIKNVKIRAKDLAQEKLLNKLADYVDGFLRDRLLTFPDDEIFSIAKEIYHITDVKYNTFDSDDNLMIRATVLAQVDDNNIMNCLVRFFKERIDLKSQNESLNKENEALKQQIITKDKNILAHRKLCEHFSSLVDLIDGSFHFGFFSPTYTMESLEEAIELSPNNDFAYYWHGFCYQGLEQYEKAIKDYSEAIELNPDYANAYKCRGECYQALGDEAKAQADFAKYEELSKKS